jgi:hypothetical protein
MKNNWIQVDNGPPPETNDDCGCNYHWLALEDFYGRYVREAYYLVDRKKWIVSESGRALYNVTHIQKIEFAEK